MGFVLKAGSAYKIGVLCTYLGYVVQKSTVCGPYDGVAHRSEERKMDTGETSEMAGIIVCPQVFTTILSGYRASNSWQGIVPVLSRI